MVQKGQLARGYNGKVLEEGVISAVFTSNGVEWAEINNKVFEVPTEITLLPDVEREPEDSDGNVYDNGDEEVDNEKTREALDTEKVVAGWVEEFKVIAKNTTDRGVDKYGTLVNEAELNVSQLEDLAKDKLVGSFIYIDELAKESRTLNARIQTAVELLSDPTVSSGRVIKVLTGKL